MASMAALFYIMSMYFYLKARTQNKLSYSIILFSFCLISGLAAVLSKENAAMLPVSIFLYDLFLIQGLNKDNIKKYSRFAALPLIVILIIGFIYTDFSAILEQYKIHDLTMIQRLLTEPRVIVFYLSLLFYPINSRLTFLYNIDVSRSLFQPWTTILAIFLIATIIGLALYIAKKRPLISFCIIFYFLNHIIEGSIFPLELIYEHRNYLPSMLLFIPLVEFIIYAVDYFSYKKTIQFACIIGIIIILTGLGDITYRRNTIVSNEFNLWFDNIEKYPNLSRPHSNLGIFYLNKGLRPQALHEYEKAMVLNNFGGIDVRAIQENNLSLYYYQEGKYSQALQYFESSHKVLPHFVSKPGFIARIKLLNNKIHEAHHLIEEQIEKYPDNDKLIELFTFILYKEGNFKEAEVFAKNFLKKNISNAFPLAILAETSRKKGNIRAAISLWKLYQQSFPQDYYANLALLELYFQTNKCKLLDEEIAKLYCRKRDQTLFSYIKDISRNKNLLIYIPDSERIENIIEKRNKTF
jgi:tetratricopeptide (TPR) repeat protein